MGRFIHESVNWLDHDKLEERENLISDSRFTKAVRNLCRFYASLIKLFQPPTLLKWRASASAIRSSKSLPRALDDSDVDLNMQTASLLMSLPCDLADDRCRCLTDMTVWQMPM